MILTFVFEDSLFYIDGEFLGDYLVRYHELTLDEKVALTCVEYSQDYKLISKLDVE